MGRPTFRMVMAVENAAASTRRGKHFLTVNTCCPQGLADQIVSSECGQMAYSISLQVEQQEQRSHTWPHNLIDDVSHGRLINSVFSLCVIKHSAMKACGGVRS
jgi:hypothetical protein